MKNKTLSYLLMMAVSGLIAFTLTGCWSAREINNLEIVVGVGVDKGNTPDSIFLTAQIVKPGEMRKPSQEGGSGGNGGGGGTAYWNAGYNGESVFEPIREITEFTGNRLFVSHSQILVFGMDIASKGIQKYMDFFIRAHEMRPSAMILISETTAAEVFNVKPEREKLPAMNIAKLIQTNSFTSHYKKVNLLEFTERLMSRTMSPVAPIVKIMESGGKKNVYISGMAVFKNYKMAGTLSDIETRGFLWVIGEIASGLIKIPMPDSEGKVILEILSAKSAITPEIKDGRVIMHIKIDEEASITEQSATGNLLTIPAFKAMQRSQEEVIRQEIQEAFEKSKKLNADIFGFGELLHEKLPSQWKDIEERWNEIYKTVELDMDIKSKILKTELITKPIMQEETDGH